MGEILRSVKAAFSLRTFVEEQIGPGGMQTLISAISSVTGMWILGESVKSGLVVGARVSMGASHSESVKTAEASNVDTLITTGVSLGKNIMTAGHEAGAFLSDHGLRLVLYICHVCSVAYIMFVGGMFQNNKN